MTSKKKRRTVEPEMATQRSKPGKSSGKQSERAKKRYKQTVFQDWCKNVVSVVPFAPGMLSDRMSMEDLYSSVRKIASAAGSANCTARTLPLLCRNSILIQWEIYDDHRKEKEIPLTGQ